MNTTSLSLSLKDVKDVTPTGGGSTVSSKAASSVSATPSVQRPPVYVPDDSPKDPLAKLKDEGKATLRTLESLGMVEWDVSYLPHGVDPALNIMLQPSPEPYVPTRWCLLPDKNVTHRMGLCFEVGEFWMMLPVIGFNIVSLPQAIMYQSTTFKEHHGQVAFDDVVACARIMLPDSTDLQAIRIYEDWRRATRPYGALVYQNEEWMQQNTAILILLQSAYRGNLNHNWVGSIRLGIDFTSLDSCRKHFILAFAAGVKKTSLLSTLDIPDDEALVRAIPWADALKGPLQALRLPEPSTRSFSLFVDEDFKKGGDMEDFFVDAVEDVVYKDFQRYEESTHVAHWGIALGFKEIPQWTRMPLEDQKRLREEVQERLKLAILGFFSTAELCGEEKDWCFNVARALRVDMAARKEAIEKSPPLNTAIGGLKLAKMGEAKHDGSNYDLQNILDEMCKDVPVEMSPLSPSLISMAYAGTSMGSSKK